MRGRDKKDKDSSFVKCSVALPKILLSITELQSEFSDHFDSCVCREVYLIHWGLLVEVELSLH